MAQNISIRPVQSNEATVLQALGASTFRETFETQNSKENLEAYLSKSFALSNVKAQLKALESEFYFAVVDEEILGYLKLNTSEKGLEIERIYVRQTAQGTGIGKAMFELSLSLAKTRKAEWLWLGVWQENIKAIEFYKRQGMEVFDTRTFQLGNDPQDDFLMRMRL